MRERIFQYVQECLAAGRPPTLREIGAAVGLSAVESVRVHMEALVAEGRLVKQPGARGYALSERPRPRLRSVPIVGRVQAGALTLAEQEIDGHIQIEGHAGSELFALRVRGESMLGAGILPGDLVVVRRQAGASAGDIVVAQVDGEATVKRLRFRAGHPELHAENPAFPDIVAAELEILGRVVEVRRTLPG